MSNLKLKQNSKSGFTLIELLVVISIIGVLVAVSIFGLSGARESARDARRKADIEMIKAGLEIYKADCGTYPTTLPAAGSSLVGTYPTSGAASCAAANTYISVIPDDPIAATRDYKYQMQGGGIGYVLCSSLEQQGLSALTCGTLAASSCGTSCNYKVLNP